VILEYSPCFNATGDKGKFAWLIRWCDLFFWYRYPWRRGQILDQKIRANKFTGRWWGKYL